MSTSAAAVAGVRRHKEAARKRNQKRESPNGHRDRGVAALRDDLTGATEKVREELSAKMDGMNEQIAALQASMAMLLERLPAAA